MFAMQNNPSLKGQYASSRIVFGPKNEHGRDRYRIAAIHTRFDAVEWMVWDQWDRDEDDIAKVIAQAESFDAALSQAKLTDVYWGF